MDCAGFSLEKGFYFLELGGVHHVFKALFEVRFLHVGDVDQSLGFFELDLMGEDELFEVLDLCV